MPEFRTEIDIDVDEFWNECSIWERGELADLVIEEGLAQEIDGHKYVEDESLLGIEWKKTIDKLLTLRQRLTIEEEELIKSIVNKY
jgi:hypothetical protein